MIKYCVCLLLLVSGCEIATTEYYSYRPQHDPTNQADAGKDAGVSDAHSD